MHQRLAAALAATTLLVLSACGSDSDDTVATEPASAASASVPTGNADPSEVSCKWISDGTEPAKQADLPPTSPTVGGEVSATLETSSGPIGLTLDATKAPCTVTSFLSLATQGYFDDTSCHRLTTSGIYVLQCGDPTATGMGGPGYAFADELSDAGDTYPAGTVAMANAGPNTNGSQFFLCYDDCTGLDASPAYTVFGTISEDGMAVLADIAAQGTTDGGTDGAPAAAPVIGSVTFN
ncbi:MAG: peptidylprolyl isomerase [Nocardioides sp.]